MVEFHKVVQQDLITRRRSGHPAKQVRINPQQLSRIEGEYAVVHKEGRMFIEGVLLVADPEVPFGKYQVE